MVQKLQLLFAFLLILTVILGGCSDQRKNEISRKVGLRPEMPAEDSIDRYNRLIVPPELQRN